MRQGPSDGESLDEGRTGALRGGGVRPRSGRAHTLWAR